MTKEEKRYVMSIIDEEGFDYTFMYYTSFKNIDDSKFHQLINNYIAATKELEAYIEIDKI